MAVLPRARGSAASGGKDHKDQFYGASPCVTGELEALPADPEAAGTTTAYDTPAARSRHQLNTCRRCELTGNGDKCSCSGASRLVAPRATSLTTANSDSVSSGQAGAERDPWVAGRAPRARSRPRTRAAS